VKEVVGKQNTMADTFTPYETGINRLLEQLGRDHPRYSEALTLQSRLVENIAQTRRYGDNETRRTDRAQIVDSLNCLALEAVGVSFNELSGQEVDVAQETMTPPEKFTRLREDLVQYFDKEELRTLCTDLGVDYDGLRGEGKEGKARELIAYLDRRGSISILIKICIKLRPQVDWEQIAHVPLSEQSQRGTPSSTALAHFFICYKRNVEPDQTLARYLYDFLTAQGHEVFIDSTLRTGEAWLEEIDRQLKASDFLVVLLSKASADSEMVKAEVSRAYEYRRRSPQGKPHTLPVRIAYEGLLPYSIAAFVDPLQYVVWQNEADNERIAYEIMAAIEGRLPQQEPIQTQPVAGGRTISEDGRIISDDESLHPPLPEFDPRFLEELEAPGGAVKLRDRFYIEREADVRLKREVVKSGTTTTIRAARQTGKSSLLVRGMHHARENGAKVVYFDLQSVDSNHLTSLDVFLRYLAEVVIHELRFDVAEVEKLWRGSLGPQGKLTYLMADYVLPKSDGLIVLAMDEVDSLLKTDFYKDFFALLRSWHNRRAFDERWDMLNIVMAISTEPYLLIADVTQSPFNVGLGLYLVDFDAAQVRDLNQRHGSPVKEQDFPQLMELLSGHPYLTRKALYVLVAECKTWAKLMQVAPTDEGPFGDHLRRLYWLLHDEPGLKEELRQIARHGRCADKMAFFRLLRAGLVKGSGDVCKCRCDLYRMYFEDKL